MRDMKLAPPQEATPNSHPSISPSPSTGHSVSATPAVEPSSSIRHFEGDTSLSAYSSSTNDQLQKAFRNTQLLQQDPDLAAALTSLSQIVSTQNVYPGEYEVPSVEKAKSNRRYGVPRRRSSPMSFENAKTSMIVSSDYSTGQTVQGDCKSVQRPLLQYR